MLTYTASYIPCLGDRVYYPRLEDTRCPSDRGPIQYGAWDRPWIGGQLVFSHMSRRRGFNPRPIHVIFVFRVLLFSVFSITPPVLHAHSFIHFHSFIRYQRYTAISTLYGHISLQRRRSQYHSTSATCSFIHSFIHFHSFIRYRRYKAISVCSVASIGALYGPRCYRSRCTV